MTESQLRTLSIDFAVQILPQKAIQNGGGR